MFEFRLLYPVFSISPVSRRIFILRQHIRKSINVPNKSGYCLTRTIIHLAHCVRSVAATRRYKLREWISIHILLEDVFEATKSSSLRLINHEDARAQGQNHRCWSANKVTGSSIAAYTPRQTVRPARGRYGLWMRKSFRRIFRLILKNGLI